MAEPNRLVSELRLARASIHRIATRTVDPDVTAILEEVSESLAYAAEVAGGAADG